MTKLLEWLTAQIADDEAAANANLDAGLTGRDGLPSWPDYETYSGNPDLVLAQRYLNRFGPVRALAEVEFKRAILARHDSDGFPCCTYCGENAPCPDLRDLAAIYADRPGYQEATGG